MTPRDAGGEPLSVTGAAFIEIETKKGPRSHRGKRPFFIFDDLPSSAAIEAMGKPSMVTYKKRASCLVLRAWFFVLRSSCFVLRASFEESLRSINNKKTMCWFLA